MTNELLDLLGNWIEHIGATIAAIGETKQLAGKRAEGYELGVKGNAIQGIGNTLIAIAHHEDAGISIGNWLQASGTTANAIAEFHMLRDNTLNEEDMELEILGDSLQSIGAMLSSIHRLKDHPQHVYGNIAQSLGAVLEGIGVHEILIGNEERGQQIEVIGGWLQSLGTGYQVIGATKDYIKRSLHQK